MQNKIGALLASPAVRNMLGQPTSTLRVGEAMDARKIIIANLSKGRLGEAASNLIGSLLITAVAMSAMKGSERPEAERQDFVAYLDEFHNFTTDAFASMLAEARKYRLALVIGHQYLDQVRPSVRAAVFGNAGTLVSFQLGYADAGEIAAEFTPYGIETLTGLGTGEVCVRSVASGEINYPFLGRTFSDVGWSYRSRQNVLRQSRRRYGRRREVVEAKIARWMSKGDRNSATKVRLG